MKLTLRLVLILAALGAVTFGVTAIGDAGASAPVHTHCGTPAAEPDCPSTTTATSTPWPPRTVPPTTTTTTTPPPTAPPAPPVHAPPHTAG